MNFISHDQLDAYLDSLDEHQIVTGNITIDSNGLWIDDVEATA